MTPDTANKCDRCIYLEYVGTYMVGSVESGGPEDFFRCSKGWNCSAYCIDRDGCPDFDTGYRDRWGEMYDPGW